MGQSRAEIAVKKLSELNSYVTVTGSTETVNEAFLAKNHVNVSFEGRNSVRLEYKFAGDCID